MKLNKLTTWILIALVLGIGVGYLCNVMAPSPAAAKEIASYFAAVTDIFLRLVKMIIAPLVFATLVAGIASMGNAQSVGRVGAKSIGWFVSPSCRWRWASSGPTCCNPGRASACRCRMPGLPPT
jgi:Na+/H+-dicarboxylate symporter